jgi:hypothetical protein
MQSSKIEYEILEDGTITITTGDLGGPNHVSADKLLKTLADLCGGEAKSRKRNRLEVGHAIDISSHTHDGHTHSHG